MVLKPFFYLNDNNYYLYRCKRLLVTRPRQAKYDLFLWGNLQIAGVLGGVFKNKGLALLANPLYLNDFSRLF